MTAAKAAALAAFLLAVGPGNVTAQVSDNERRLTAARAWVSLSELAAHTSFLASDALYGRAPGTPGDDAAAQYIAAQFQRAGLLPGGSDGTYFQRIPLIGVTPSPAIMIGIGARNLSLNYPGDFVAQPERPDTFLIAGGNLSFVGHGIVAPEHAWDDYKFTPLNGSVLLVLAGLPGALADFEAYADIEYKLQEAAARGATGVLFVHSDSAVGIPWPVLRNRWTRELVKPLQAQSRGLDFTGWITHAAARRVFDAIGVDWDVLVRRASLREFRPVDGTLHLAVDIKSRVRSFEGLNVIGTIRGSRFPERSVLITAHHDYLGVARGSTPDSIYNGARVHAANVAGLLTMASALAAAGVVAPTTLSFVAATAGESGAIGIQSYLWGMPTARQAIQAGIVIEEANLWGPTADVAVRASKSIEQNRSVLAAAAHERFIASPTRGRYRAAAISQGGAEKVLAGASVPVAVIGAGSQLSGDAPGARDLAIATYYERHFGRTSDNMLPDFDFRGLQDQTRFAIRLAWSLAQIGVTPAN